MKRFYALGGAVALSLVFVGGDAHAQFVKVAFSPVDGVAPVPLSPWAMGLVSFLLALFAWRGLRRKSTGHDWPLVLLASLGLMFVGTLKPWLPEAAAVTWATSFKLAFPSPTVSPYLQPGADISAVNTTGQTIRIDGVTGPDGNFFLYLDTPSRTPKCEQGLILAPDAICFVRIGVGGSS